MSVCACWTIYLVAVCQSGDACQSACCQTHPGDSENHMTHTGAEGFYRSVPDSLGDDTPTGTERNHPSDHEQNLRVTRGQVHFTSPHHKNIHIVASASWSLSRCWSHCLGVELSLLIVHIITYSLKHNRTHTRLKSLVYTPNQSKNRSKWFRIRIIYCRNTKVQWVAHNVIPWIYTVHGNRIHYYSIHMVQE